MCSCSQPAGQQEVRPTHWERRPVVLTGSFSSFETSKAFMGQLKLFLPTQRHELIIQEAEACVMSGGLVGCVEPHQVDEGRAGAACCGQRSPV